MSYGIYLAQRRRLGARYGKKRRAHEISAQVLLKMKATAEDYLGER